MTGSSLAPYIIPIVAAVCLAFLLGIVYYADSHPEWKRSGQEPAHTTAGQASSPAVASATGSGELTDEPGRPDLVPGARRRAPGGASPGMTS
jgi:hypothetical protein